MRKEEKIGSKDNCKKYCCQAISCVHFGKSDKAVSFIHTFPLMKNHSGCSTSALSSNSWVIRKNVNISICHVTCSDPQPGYRGTLVWLKVYFKCHMRQIWYLITDVNKATFCLYNFSTFWPEKNKVWWDEINF